MNVQVPLFVKILSFDRSLKSRVGSKIVIGILYQRKFRASLDAMNEFTNDINGLSAKSIDQIPVVVEPINIEEGNNLREVVARESINVLYITPLRGFDMKTLIELARDGQMLTLTGVPEYVDEGVALGIEIRKDRAQILINLGSAKAEGADFNAQLLNLARIVR